MVFILCDLVQSTLTHISKKPTSVVETWIYGKCIYNMHADHINTCCLAALCVLEIHLVFKRYVEKSTDKQKIYIYLIFYKFIFLLLVCCWFLCHLKWQLFWIRWSWCIGFACRWRAVIIIWWQNRRKWDCVLRITYGKTPSETVALQQP